MTTEDRQVRNGYLELLNEALGRVLPWVVTQPGISRETLEWTVGLVTDGPVKTRWQAQDIQAYGWQLVVDLAPRGAEVEVIAFTLARFAEMYTSRFRLTPANLDEDRGLLAELKEMLSAS